MTKKIPGFIPALAWLFISIFLLTIPGSSIPKENWLEKIGADKWVHIVLFGLLVFLWCRAIVRSGAADRTFLTYFLWITVIAILYGIAMEFVQKYLVANRSFDLWDIVADSVGGIAGYVFSRRRYIKK